MVGGGSAGHVVPAIPVIRVLQSQGHRVTFVGTRSGLEEELLSGLQVPFHAIAAGKLRRYWSWRNVADLFRIVLGVLQAVRLLFRLRPDVVFSKGGFVSFPLVFAAWLLRIPAVAHESDLSPGLANRLVLPFIRTLCVSFDATEVPRRGLKVVHTGTPVRQDMLHGDAGRGRQRLGLAEAGKPLLVVTGGSLGAEFLNRMVHECIAELSARFVVFHVCGAGKLQPLQQPDYHQVEYVGEGWGDLLAAADLVVSRAGANALFELLALGKVSLLVPLPRLASRGDQIENAAYARARGYCQVIEEQDMTAQVLLDTLAGLAEQQQQYRQRLRGFREQTDVSRAAELIAAEINAVS